MDYKRRIAGVFLRIGYAILAFFICTNIIYAAQNTTGAVLVTGAIKNETIYPWAQNFLFVDAQDFYHDLMVNINPDDAPAVGRFIIPAKVGATYIIKLVSNLMSQKGFIDICIFQVKVISTTHATMKLIKVNNNTAVLCHYSGNPDDNTATITLTNANQNRSL